MPQKVSVEALASLYHALNASVLVVLALLVVHRPYLQQQDSSSSRRGAARLGKGEAATHALAPSSGFKGVRFSSHLSM